MDIVYFKPKNIFCCTYKLTKILKFQFNFNTKVLAVLKHLSYLKDRIDLKQSIFIILLFIIDAIGKQEHYQITMHYEHEVLYSVHNGFNVLSNSNSNSHLNFMATKCPEFLTKYSVSNLNVK